MISKDINISKILIFSLVLLFLSSCSPVSSPESSRSTSGNGGADGVLSHTVLSPFNDELEKQEAAYFAGETNTPSKTIIKSRYKDFALNYDTVSLGFNSEPFCKIGGMYKIKISNTNPLAQDFSTQTDLFYCKTTLDLINQIKIPNSWKNANLIFYCNDGNSINFADVNFDFITTKINTYKSCVLKNLDLKEKNAILYGIEVGNKIVDDNPNFLFDESSATGQITKDLTVVSVEKSEPRLSNQTKKVVLDYIESCKFDENINESNNSTCKVFNKSCSFIPPPGPGLKFCTQELVQEENSTCSLPQNKNCDIVNLRIKGDFPSAVNIKRINDDDVTKRSTFEFEEIVGFNLSDFILNDSNGDKFFFSYNSFETFYTLSENSEELSVPITNIFNIPNDFELSRVALFRSFSDGRKAFGLESPIRFRTTSTSTKPVYRISIEGANGAQSSQSFSQKDCFETLASYEAKKKDIVSTADTIICTSTDQVFLNSLTLDQTFDKTTAFNLFKNIILDLE